MALFDPSIFDAFVFDTSQIAPSAIPIPIIPPFFERHFTATIPITVTIRQPYNAIIPLQANIRVPYHASITLNRRIRMQFTESFIAKRPIVTREFKRLLERTRRYLEEE